MADTTITQAMIDLAGGEAVAAFALGKTRSQFAAAMVPILEVAIATGVAAGADVVTYTFGGRTVSRSFGQAQQAIEYFQRVERLGTESGGCFMSLPIESQA